MYKVYNNIEDKNIFEGNEREFIEFAKSIVAENGDFMNFSIIGISDAKEYMEDFCDNLELTIELTDQDRNIIRCADWFKNSDERVSLNRLLEEISVMEVASLDNHDDNPMLKNWFAVTDTNGIIAYFGDMKEAFHYRLDYINRILNTL